MSPVPEQWLRNYWDLLFAHRLSSEQLGEPLQHGMEAVMAGEETGPFDYRAFDGRVEYCFARGLSSFLIARLPGFLDEGPDLTPKQQERIIAYLRDFATHLERKGWLGRGFVMVWNEPREHRWPEVLKELQTVHRAHPRLRTRLDGPVVGPVVANREPEVEVWVMRMKSLAEGGPEAKANAARWRKHRKQLWTYVACDVHHPYPNVFIDYPLIDCRILPWVNWRYDIEGLLYWCVNWWAQANLAGKGVADRWPHRPWVSANFIKGGGGKGNEYNGDGHLIYPAPQGTALSSVRLEALRDGVEDFEYVWLLEQAITSLESSGKASNVVAEAKGWLAKQSVVCSFSEWCRDPEALMRARVEIAALIVKAGRQ